MFSGCGSVAGGSIPKAGLILKFKIHGCEKAVEECKLFAKEIAALASKKRAKYGTVPPRIVPMQTAFVHKTRFPTYMYKDTTWFERYQHIYSIEMVWQVARTFVQPGCGNASGA